MKTHLWTAFVVGSAILTSVFAGRLSEVAQRKGFSKRLVENIAGQKLEARAATASSLRFYNNDTKSQPTRALPIFHSNSCAEYFVKSLPDIPQVLHPGPFHLSYLTSTLPRTL